jgi:hypothetical protein
MRGVSHIVRVEDMGDAYRILFGKYRNKGGLGRTGHIREDDIKVDLGVRVYTVFI